MVVSRGLEHSWTGFEDFPIVDDRSFARDGRRAIGAGGFGVTYLARNATGHRVVIKELRSDRQPRFGKRFAQEARILSQLHHESIVRVLQLGRWQTTGRLFYVMEYIEGQTLDIHLNERRLDIQFDNLCLLADVARAVSYAHRAGIIHRDLKPANVIVRPNGRAVVIDWGLAGDPDPDQDAGFGGEAVKGALTQEGAGSPFYMSPEQARGKPPSPSMDIYSLGAMLYELLCGIPPFKDMDGEDPRIAVIKKEPTSLVGRVDQELLHVVDLAMYCLDRDASKRPLIDEVLARIETSQRCLCGRCGHVGDRTDATRISGLWVCGSCRMLTAFDTIYGTRQRVADGAKKVSRVQVQAPEYPVIPADIEDADPTAASSYEGLVRGAVLEEHGGVRSTLATDELGREVVIEELLPEANEDARASFQAALELMTRSPSTLLPRVYRSSPTMFVREHATGQAITELANRLDEEAVRKLLGLCGALVQLHRQGVAHGGLSPSGLLVRSGAGSEVIAVNWRNLKSIKRPRISIEAIADVRAILKILRSIFTEKGGKWASAAKTIKRLHRKSIIIESELATVVQCLDGLLREVPCRICSKRVVLDEAMLSGRGYACHKCIAEVVDVARDGLDLHFTKEEMHGLMQRHRKVYLRSIPVTLGFVFLAQFFSAIWTLIFIAPAAMGAFERTMFHRDCAMAYKRHLQGKRRPIADWLSLPIMLFILIIMYMAVGLIVQPLKAAIVSIFL